MTITLKQLAALSSLDKVIIHSFDMSLYLVSVEINGEEQYLVDNKTGLPVKERHHIALQKLFENNNVGATVLRQKSAYDEMVGQPARAADNMMEVPLSGVAMG